MRPLLLAGLFLSAAAQAQVPDTISADRYVPLEIGNTWHYEDWRAPQGSPLPNPPSELFAYLKHEVVGDSLVSGERCFEVAGLRFSPSGSLVASGSQLVRFNDEIENLISCSDDSYSGLAFYYASPCPLSAAFGSFIAECSPVHSDVEVGGGYHPAMIGSDLGGAAVKTFIPMGMEASYTVVADIGFAGYSFWNDYIQLVYARVDGVEFGSPVPVSSDPAPAAVEGLALNIFPSPASGQVIATVSLATSQPMHLEIFDLLGRRLQLHDMGALPAGEHEVRIDTAALAPGSYIARIVGADGQAAVTRFTSF